MQTLQKKKKSFPIREPNPFVIQIRSRKRSLKNVFNRLKGNKIYDVVQLPHS